MIPRFRSIVTAYVQSFVRSLAMTFVTRFPMVSLESETCLPISSFASSAATSCSTSISCLISDHFIHPPVKWRPMSGVTWDFVQHTAAQVASGHHEIGFKLNPAHVRLQRVEGSAGGINSLEMRRMDRRAREGWALRRHRIRKHNQRITA